MLPNQETVRFGLYTADLHAAELRRGHDSVPLQNLPFRLLAVLLREPGKVVTRDELRRELWPADTFVDFERGISTAVNKLREALGDSATNPRFIETVGRRGYRFIAPVSVVTPAHLSAAVAEAPGVAVAAAPRQVEKPAESLLRAPQISPRKRIAFLTLALVAIALAALAFDWIARFPSPRITKMVQLTFSGKTEPGADLHTDGSRLYFVERSGATWSLMQTSVAGGEVVPVQSPFPEAVILGISPDRSQLLVRTRGRYGDKHALWIIPIQGGTPQRVGDLMVDQAGWYPDGQRLLCASGDEVFSVELDGTHRRHLFDVDGHAFRFHWRPDGRSFRFSVDQSNDRTHLWEAATDGSNPHQFLPEFEGTVNECCGSWSPDGKNYVFTAHKGDLWLIHESAGWPWRATAKPVRLTNGPTSFSDPVFSPDGKKIFATGLQPQGYVARFDSQSHQFSRAALPSQAFDLAFSHDGKWVAFVAPPGLTLWRSRIDGSEKLQMTTLPASALRPRWSPDDKQILFVARMRNERYSAYIVSADGGALQPVIENDNVYRDYADWSPDQRSVIVGVGIGEAPGAGIALVDLATHRLSELPGSKGLAYPRWSPRGDYVAAASEDFKQIFLFDTRSQTWKQVASAAQFWKAEWEPDGSHVFYQDARDPVQAIFRLDPATGKSERVADCSKFLSEGALRCSFEGRAPDGSLMFSVAASWANLYAFDVELP